MEEEEVVCWSCWFGSDGTITIKITNKSFNTNLDGVMVGVSTLSVSTSIGGVMVGVSTLSTHLP